MHEGITWRAAKPWFDDASAALQQEQEGHFQNDASPPIV